MYQDKQLKRIILTHVLLYFTIDPAVNEAKNDRVFHTHYPQILRLIFSIRRMMQYYTNIIENILRFKSPPASLNLGKVDYRPPGGNVGVFIDWNIAKYCVVQVGRTPTQPLGDRLPTNYIDPNSNLQFYC